MNALKNKVSMIGNLGSNPQVSVLSNNKKVAKLSLATNEVFRTSAGEKKTETHWHNLIAWGRNAEIAESYLQKGYEIAVEGRLVNRWFTKKDGEKKQVTEIVISNLLILGNKA
jgi:single-strand DNA-binding protein